MSWINVGWWLCYAFAGITLQALMPGLDFLLPGFILALQERRYPQILAVGACFVLLQEGMGSMAFGGTYGSASEPGSEQNRCFVAAMREALAVARAEGVDVTEADLAQMAALTASLDPAGMPSMAQDRINEKPTEVEEFSGTICRLAERHGLLVPTNQWLYQRIRELEAGFSR